VIINRSYRIFFILLLSLIYYFYLAAVAASLYIISLALILVLDLMTEDLVFGSRPHDTVLNALPI
jgi:hypothetical protein